MREYYQYLKNERKIHGQGVWGIFNDVLPNMRTIQGPIVLSMAQQRIRSPFNKAVSVSKCDDKFIDKHKAVTYK